ncbi:hypothetical protein H663_001445 [Limnohabitans planktonicus II-D5]|uniref:Uncharacterized protein n=1 Tax=Limnohabitans planktonicus II-D5 TaxID=1293045 RepID=A0A2T7UJ48_9BURK|nr:hypothetical protein H663_001445 [Limnohabitans planktonicus II-D5]
MCEPCHLAGRHSKSPTLLGLAHAADAGVVAEQALVGVFDHRPTKSNAPQLGSGFEVSNAPQPGSGFEESKEPHRRSALEESDAA